MYNATTKDDVSRRSNPHISNPTTHFQIIFSENAHALILSQPKPFIASNLAIVRPGYNVIIQFPTRFYFKKTVCFPVTEGDQKQSGGEIQLFTANFAIFSSSIVTTTNDFRA
jgi:hypothetical protein